MGHFDMLYGRRIKRRTGDDPVRPGDLRPSVPAGEGQKGAVEPMLIPEVSQRAAPAAPQRRGRGVPRSKPRV